MISCKCKSHDFHVTAAMPDVFLSTASSSNALLHRNATNRHFKCTTHVLVSPHSTLNRLSLALPNLTAQGRNYSQRTPSQTAQQRCRRQELFLLLTFLHVGPCSLRNQVPVRASLTLFLVAKKPQLLLKTKIVSLSPLNVMSRNVDCFQASLAPFLITWITKTGV